MTLFSNKVMFTGWGVWGRRTSLLGDLMNSNHRTPYAKEKPILPHAACCTWSSEPCLCAVTILSLFGAHSWFSERGVQSPSTFSTKGRV